MNGWICKAIIYPAVALFCVMPFDSHAFECHLSAPEAALSKAKRAIRKDRWDADAQTCIVLAYDRLGHPYRAIMKLREIEEQLPQHVIDRIHDLLWQNNPELLARKESLDRFTMSGGDCIIKNTSMIDGYGYLLIGGFYNPLKGQTMRHIASYKCDRSMDYCRERSLICPECILKTPEAVIKVRAYRIEEVYHIGSESIERNLRYIKAVLELERGLNAR